MQSLIERLKQQATANIADGQPLDTYGVTSHPDSKGVLHSTVFGAMVTNGEALQIAEILEVASYPPMVRTVLSTMEFLPKNEVNFFWVSVNATGTVRTHEYKPVFVAGGWRPKIGISIIQFELPVLGISEETAATLLFERAESWWQWAFSETHNSAQK